MPNWFKKILGGKDEPAPAEDGDLFPTESPAFLADPYPFYEKLRKEHPVYRTADGVWVLSRYADIKEALDHEFLGNRPSRFSTLHPSKADKFVCANLANNILPFLDGPIHKEHRRHVAKVFTKEMKAIVPQLDALAEEAVADLPLEFEVIEDLGHPFAIKVICTILGIPVDPKLRDWSSSFIYLFTKIPSAEVREQIDEHLTQFRDWLRDYMKGDNLTGVIAGFKELVDEGELSEIVAIDSMILLFADGLENVDSGIGTAVLLFAQHPEEWQKLCNDESLLDTAPAECLRYDSPAHFIARTCLEDFEWLGQEFKKDITVILLLASSSRDSEVFENPDTFDIARSHNPHLSFGQGKHSCLGGKLVELELRAILGALRKATTTFELKNEITWQNRKGHRWMEKGIFARTPAN